MKDESVSASAVSVASGDLTEREELGDEIKEVGLMMQVLKNGGMFHEQTHERLPSQVEQEYNEIEKAWNDYKLRVGEVTTSSRFNPEAVITSEYVLDKNQEMGLLANQITSDLQNLDRDYNTHKQIASDLVECIKDIGEQAFLSRTGWNLQQTKR